MAGFDSFDGGTAIAAKSAVGGFSDFDSGKPAAKPVAPPDSGPIRSLFSSDAGKWLAGTFEKTGPPTQERVKVLARDTALNLSAVASMLLLDVPGTVMGVGADLNARLMGAGNTLETRQESSAAGQRIGKEVAAKFTGLVPKIMGAFGYGKDYEEGDVVKAMGVVAGWLEQGAEHVEKMTGGKLTKDDGMSLIDTVMAAGGVAGIRAGIQWATKKPGSDARANLIAGNKAKAAADKKAGVAPAEPPRVYADETPPPTSTPPMRPGSRPEIVPGKPNLRPASSPTADLLKELEAARAENAVLKGNLAKGGAVAAATGFAAFGDEEEALLGGAAALGSIKGLKYAESPRGPELIAPEGVSITSPKKYLERGGLAYYMHDIQTPEGKTAGKVHLGWEGGEVRELIKTETSKNLRDQGINTGALESILGHNAPNTKLYLYDVEKPARDWWTKRGAKLFPTDEGRLDGTITRADLQTYIDKRGTAGGEAALRRGDAEAQRTSPPPTSLGEVKAQGEADAIARSGLGDNAKALGAAGATALAAWLNPEDAEGIGLGGAAAIGAIKGKGGMWHPEAVERLVKPLKEKFHSAEPATTESVVAAGKSQQWADKSIRNYLNRYAGTAEDPLAGVELSSGKTWGEMSDSAFKSARADRYQIPATDEIAGLTQRDPALRNVPADEAVWRLGDMPGNRHRVVGKAESELTSYLSHVGDYLRQNVDPAKLGQYDLVRAVKETAAWDKLMKAEMEKARSKSQEKLFKDATVYKDYGDGMRWIQLNRPGQFADESTQMGHSVRGYEPPKLITRQGDPADLTWKRGQGPHPDWIPESELGLPKGQESSGHPHYNQGGWEAIKRGEVEVYSLRDKDGGSHATVEVSNLYDQPGGKVVEQDILQIKGKQNRAPAAAYLPMVQDFVKSGKWGEVGDLEETGLRDITKVKGQDGYDLKGEEFFGNRFVSREAADQFAKGSRDPALKQLAIGGAAAGAALALDDGEDSGAAAAGMLGLAGMRRGARETLISTGKGLDYALGAVSTRLGNVSEALKFRAREFERRVLHNTHLATQQIEPFLRGLKGTSGKLRDDLDLALLTNDGAAVKRLIAPHPELAKGYTLVEAALDAFNYQLKSTGRFAQGLTDYFPRVVNDFEGLNKFLGKTAAAGLEKVMNAAEADSLKNKQRAMTDVERSLVVNRYLLSTPAANLPRHLQSRSIPVITKELRPFYEAPENSLIRYVQAAVQDIETARFFGKDLKLTTKANGAKAVNLDDSIGGLVDSEMRAGKMDGKGAEEVKSILSSRFKEGEQGAAPIVQHMRNLANAGLLGNFVSAATQLGDLGTSVYAQGFRDSMVSVAKTLTSRQQISPKDFGLANHISEEFSSKLGTARVLQTVFKYSGFSAVDMFGKRTTLNAALYKYQRWSQSAEGEAKIAEKYAEAFGSDFPDLVRDLKSRRMTDNVRGLLFSELSDLQPISKLEMPQGYLDMPNGRIVYMLKTFMLKQMDVVRRDTFQEIAKGNVARGLKNLTAYALTLGIAGATTDMIKDFILGKPFDAKWEDIPLNVLKTFGWSKYNLDKAKGGHPVAAVAGMIAPPYQMLDDIVRRDPKAIQYIPIVGKLYYQAKKDEWKEERKERKKLDRMMGWEPRP